MNRHKQLIHILLLMSCSLGRSSSASEAASNSRVKTTGAPSDGAPLAGALSAGVKSTGVKPPAQEQKKASSDSTAEKYPKRQVKIKISGKSPIAGKMLDIQYIESQFSSREITTGTPYDKGTSIYRGVNLKDLLSKIGNSSSKAMRFKSPDGYVQTWTLSEIEIAHPILAFMQDGHYIETKDKGSFRIILDYNNKEVFEQKAFATKWVWQVNEIEFVD